MLLTMIGLGALLLAGCGGGADAAHPAAQATASAAASGTALAARASATPKISIPANIGGSAPAVHAGAVAANAGGGGRFAGLEPQLDAQQIYTALQAAKLPASDGTNVTATSDPDQQLGKPGGYTSRVDFLVTSLAPPGTSWTLADGGAIEVFATDADARKAMQALARDNAAHPSEHDYLSKTIILRLAMNVGAVQQSSYGLAMKRAVEDDLRRQYRAASVPSSTPGPTQHR